MSHEDSRINVNFATAWPLPGVRPSRNVAKKIFNSSERNERSIDQNMNGVGIPSVGHYVVKTSCNMIPNSFSREKQKDDIPGLETKSTNDDNLAETGVVIDLEERKRLRRERQKIKKEAKKHEKAMKREEEIRKMRLAPKDQKVTLIDPSVLERFQVKGMQPAQAAVITPICSTAEFPTLGEIMSSGSKPQLNKTLRRIEINTERSQDNTVTYQKHDASSADSKNNFDQKEDEKSTAVVLQDKEKNFNKNSNFEDIPKTTNSEEIPAGKRPKRKDLIQLDIHKILKAKESKADSRVKQQRQQNQTRKVDVPKYVGNALDSDNPQMKRGKHREIPKPKRPSALKQVILQDRAKRRESTLQNSLINSVQNSEIKVLDNKEISNCVENIAFSELENKNSELSYENSKENETKPNILNTDSETNNAVKENSVNSYLEKLSEDADRVECVEEATTEECKSDKDIVCSGEVNDDNGPAEIIVDKSPKPKIHSRKFRDYCDHCISPEILNSTTALLEDIIRFHDRQYARSPLKASAKRRHVTGLKEVRRFLALRKIRLLVIAPDLESSDGLFEIISQIKESAIVNGVPYVFALGRRQLGFILKKKVPVSCVGVLNYEGTEHNFHNLMSAVERGRELYKDRISHLSPIQNTENVEKFQDCTRETVIDDVNKEVVATLLAKLTETKEKYDSSFFLEAIERCAESDSDNASKGNEE